MHLSNCILCGQQNHFYDPDNQVSDEIAQEVAIALLEVYPIREAVPVKPQYVDPNEAMIKQAMMEFKK